MKLYNQVQNSLDSLFDCALKNLSDEKQKYKTFLTNKAYNLNFNVLCFQLPRQIGYSTWVLNKSTNISLTKDYKVLIIVSTVEFLDWYKKPTVNNKLITEVTIEQLNKKIEKNKKKTIKDLEQFEYVFIDIVNYVPSHISEFILDNFKGKLIVSNGFLH